MDSVKPVRLQLSRKVGFNLQEHSRAVNGLPAVNVARPSKWGNPYRIGDTTRRGWNGRAQKITPQIAVECFRSLAIPDDAIAALKGNNLACWCSLEQPFCHAEVLLDVVNRPVKLASSRGLFAPAALANAPDLRKDRGDG